MWGLVGPPEPVIAPASASLFIIPATETEEAFSFDSFRTNVGRRSLVKLIDIPRRQPIYRRVRRCSNKFAGNKYETVAEEGEFYIVAS